MDELPDADSQPAATVGTFIWDVQKDVLYWDEGAAWLHGGALNATAGARAFVSTVHPADRARIEAALLAAIDPAGRNFSAEYRVAGLAGAFLRRVLVQGRCSFDAGNRPLRLMGTVADVTAEHRARAEQRLFDEQLFDALAHDLREGLRGVAAMVQSRLDSLDPQSRKSTNAALRGLTRAAAELTDFARSRICDAIAIQRRPADLSQVVADAVRSVSAQHPAAQVQVRGRADGMASVDAARIGQALVQLLGNAVRHARRGTPITVQLETANGQAWLRVHNFGEPIPELLRERLFEPFLRGPPMPGGDGGAGAGLGLFLVRQIALAHGGELSVASNAQQGTVFELRFPLEP